MKEMVKQIKTTPEKKPYFRGKYKVKTIIQSGMYHKKK